MLKPATDRTTLPPAPRYFVVMGVSGCGKSHLGSRLAMASRLPFIEGDDFHSPASIEKMAAGSALDDDDRAAWLVRLQDALRQAPEGAVLACSALKRRYRDTLRQAAPSIVFVQLDGSRALLEQRLRSRTGHFMSPHLLDSQLADLEPLQPDEAGVVLSTDWSASELVAAVLALN